MAEVLVPNVVMVVANISNNHLLLLEDHHPMINIITMFTNSTNRIILMED